MSFDFTKKFPPPIVTVDHDTGMLHVPGVGPLPLVGPTSGKEYQDLKKSLHGKAELNRRMMDIFRRHWQCTQCKKIWKVNLEPICQCSHFFHQHVASLGFSGKRTCQARNCPCAGFVAYGELPFPKSQPCIRIVRRRSLEGGPVTEVLACADAHCDGPVVPVTVNS